MRQHESPLCDLSSLAACWPISILIPVYNDWDALAMLLEELDKALADVGLKAGLLICDDGSTTPPPAEFYSRRSFSSIASIEVLSLRRNLGHQRALAIGIAFVEDRGSCEFLVIMDGDGEDDPRDVPRLLERARAEGGTRIIFAERTRRSESTVFRVFYSLYKGLHRLLIGRDVRVGNFSAVPRSRLISLAVVSDLWNHYAAAVFSSRQPTTTIPTSRARRLHGDSGMNFVALVVHGLSAISTYSEIIGVRLLVVVVLLIILDVLGIMAIVFIRLATDMAIPGWATYAVGILAVLLIQLFTVVIIFIFVTLGGRNNSYFLPKRDYPYFIATIHPLFQGVEDE